MWNHSVASALRSTPARVGLAAALLATPAFVLGTTVGPLHPFSNGNLADAVKVNENFVTLRDAIDTNATPRGIISMWSGSLATVPAGWALCDGQPHIAPNGETVTPPDLRGRFLRGAATGVAPGGTGGAATHAHAIPQSYLTVGALTSFPKLKWQTPVLMSSSEVILWTNWADHDEADNTADSAPTHTQTQGGIDTNAGSTLPPYFDVAYIMKL